MGGRFILHSIFVGLVIFVEYVLHYVKCKLLSAEFIHNALEDIVTGQTLALESKFVEFEGYMLCDNFIRVADADELVVLYYPNSEMSAIKSGLIYEKVRVKGYSFSIRSFLSKK